MDRQRALEVLGLPPDSDRALLKRRYRVLARDRHPDRGGDPAAFVELGTAYAQLLGELAPEGPQHRRTVARGRPSRTEDATDVALRLDGTALDRDAQALAERLEGSGSARFLSRSPGSPLNRLSGSLTLGSPSSLTVTLRSDGMALGHVELTGRSRAARRALTRLDLSTVAGAAWTRRRGDAVTVLEARITAALPHRTAAAVAGLLAVLRWPLHEWSPEP